MKKNQDYIQHFQGAAGTVGQARIRIYEGSGQPSVVVCTQDSQSGPSIQMFAENIISEVRNAGLLPSNYLWFEHFPSGAQYIPMVQRVTFAEKGGKYTSPSFAKSSRKEVEQLVGEPIE